VRKALVVAGVEFRAFVRAKSFVIGLLFPLLMMGGVMAVEWASKPDRPAPPATTRIAVVDRSGVLYDALEIAAAQRNRRLLLRAAPFALERADAGDGEADAALVERVKSGELAALVEIPADAETSAGESVRLRVVAHGANESELAFWLESSVREELRTRALRRSGLSNEVRARLGRSVVASLESPDGAGGVAPEPDAAPAIVRPALHQLGPLQKLVIAAPLGFILLLAVSLSAAPLFQAVLEEKTNRISEILISSISTSELMLGKLLGSLAACSIAAAVYGGLLLAVLMLMFGAAIPAKLMGLFVVYLVLSLLLWGGIFLSIGAACADTKDAQNLMLPVVLVQVLPMMFMSQVMANPGGAIARGLSLVPLTAPVTMFIRLGHDPAPPAWEIAVSLALLAAGACASVWAAGRVLRVGMLAYGRSASLREIARWVRSA
jgi:ABC-2 type transport system permease protein